jgi:uncharacterized protein (DUF1810 family)
MLKSFMPDEFQHFLDAQEAVFDQVIQELSAGRKESHWMWFIFPQIQGLGHSPMARKFALDSLEQAKRYAEHPACDQRLRQCTKLVTQIQGRTVSEIFGFPDDLKFHASMTLFSLAVPEDPVFKLALEKYFNGEADQRTMELLEFAKRPVASPPKQDTPV